MLEKNSLVSLTAPLSVNLEVTDHCNLSCSFCFQAQPAYVQLTKEVGQVLGESSLDPKVAIRLIEQKQRLMHILDRLAEAGVFEIRFFGGEFTVFKYWREVMEYANTRGFFISFVSNGYGFTDKDVKLFADCGVRECNISVHGTEQVHDKITQRPGSFQRAMRSIGLLKTVGIRVSVAYTPNADNLEHVYQFVSNLYEEFGIKDFGINRLFRDERYRNLTLNDYMFLFDQIDRCAVDFGVNIALIDSFPRCRVPMKFWKYLAYCSQGVGFGQVDFNGNVKHCSAINAPLGNVLKDDLSGLWKGGLASMRQLDHLPLSCKICPIFCGGGCTASRGVENKFVPDEFIPWPKDESKPQALLKAMYNRSRKIVFSLFYREKAVADPSVRKLSLSDLPNVTRRYRVRREDEDTFLVMFENSGTRILSSLAVEVLKRMDGQHDLAVIANTCRSLGFDCSNESILAIAQSLPV